MGILIEELHEHIYLKSPYCQDRWKPYSSKSTSAAEGGTPLLRKSSTFFDAV